MKLHDAIELFLGEHKPTTRRAYAKCLHPMQDHLGPARPLQTIEPAHLVEFVQHLKTKNYAPATLQQRVRTLKTFFNWCERMEINPRNPAKAVRGKKVARNITRDKAMTDDELAAILNRVQFKPRDYALILFLADTGCRRGGAAGLKSGDLDLIHLRATVTEKGDKTRPVAFSDDCARAIAKWLAHRAKRYTITGPYIWSRDGEPMKAENISLIIRRACRAAGVRTLSAHALRHRKGHQFADHKVPPSIAATALGHTDVLVTLQHYYPADWETAELELRKLAGLPKPDQKLLKVNFNDS